MRSVRLDKALEAQLNEAARVSGESVSDIIRQAIQDRCRAILGERLQYRLADVTGIVRSGGGRARKTGEAFVSELKRRKARRRR